MESVRFIIISTLPDNISNEINILREKLKEVTGACQALTYPPHITLRTGVIVPFSEIQTFIKEFGEIVKDVVPFEIENGRIKIYELHQQREIKEFDYL